jgi:hypothetical protein
MEQLSRLVPPTDSRLLSLASAVHRISTSVEIMLDALDSRANG